MISVIVPVYNAEAYLSRCMESILNQTYRDIRVICVNDGSTDGTGEMLEEFARRDGRVKVVCRTNSGLSASRNAGLELAEGEYVMFVDADDWLDGHACADAVEAMERREADIVFWSYAREYETASSPVRFWPEERVFDGKSMIWLRNRLLGPDGSELACPERLDSYGTAWGKLYRSSLFREGRASFVDTALIGSAEDVLCNLSLFGAARRAVYIPSTFYHYRKTAAGALTKRYKPGLTAQWEELFRRMARHVRENGASPEAERALRNRMAVSLIFLGLNICDAPGSSLVKCGMLRTLLKRDWCRATVKKLPLAPLPPHWKVFFLNAKLGFVPGLYLLLKAIKQILAR
ncbi:glycosyltransferase family 2 protein [Akkermansia sp.]|uniref:glycosyltransferase family 2 protein n=1 Tax=Akkermansia sp. TaxID=1872421 RepID=UPI003A8D5DA6